MMKRPTTLRELRQILTPLEWQQAQPRICDYQRGYYGCEFERLLQGLNLNDPLRWQRREEQPRRDRRRTTRDDALKVLGLEPNATDEQIKRAYRTMARQCHPDKPNGDVERMKAINAAYAVLGGK